MSVANDIVEYIVELCANEGRLDLSKEVFMDVLKQYETELVNELAQAIAEKLIAEGIKIV